MPDSSMGLVGLLGGAMVGFAPVAGYFAGMLSFEVAVLLQLGALIMAVFAIMFMETPYND